MQFLKLFKYLLPNAEAWGITISSKNLSKFFTGISNWLEGTDGPKYFADKVHEDIYPDTTRQLDQWETQWGFTAGTLSEQQRRDRLNGAWSALGGQSPKYIQDVLHANGFTQLFVHEWWQLPALPVDSPTPRNAYTILELGQFNDATFVVDGMQCEAANAQCEDEGAQTMGPYGADTVHYAISNLPLDPEPSVPNDITKWPYFYYIAGEVFTDAGAGFPTITVPSVPANQRSELERVLSKINPTQNWVGIIVNYT